MCLRGSAPRGVVGAGEGRTRAAAWRAARGRPLVRASGSRQRRRPRGVAGCRGAACAAGAVRGADGRARPLARLAARGAAGGWGWGFGILGRRAALAARRRESGAPLGLAPPPHSAVSGAAGMAVPWLRKVLCQVPPGAGRLEQVVLGARGGGAPWGSCAAAAARGAGGRAGGRAPGQNGAREVKGRDGQRIRRRARARRRAGAGPARAPCARGLDIV
jgi:hypothetical protein